MHGLERLEGEMGKLPPRSVVVAGWRNTEIYGLGLDRAVPHVRIVEWLDGGSYQRIPAQDRPVY